MKRPTFLPGVKGADDVRYERKQSEQIQALSMSTPLPKYLLAGIKVDSLRPWIGRRLAELVSFDDEVLVGTVVNWLEEHTTLEAGELILLLTPFMGRGQAQTFAQELWGWLGKARASETGIPQELAQEYEQLLETERKEMEEAKARAFQRRHLGGDRRRGPEGGTGPSRRYYEREEGQRRHSPSNRRESHDARLPAPRPRSTRYPDDYRYVEGGRRSRERRRSLERRRSPGRKHSPSQKSLVKTDSSSSYSTPSRSRSRTKQSISPARKSYKEPPSPSSDSSNFSDDREGRDAHHSDTDALAIYDDGKSLDFTAAVRDDADEEKSRRLQDRARRLMNQD